ncbi:ferredoxin reductase family protein [Martelella alba]|uniref:Oxidoreductase n=1 Tax=Martelella alba TaxID=2590451 RepID=A0ABY2SKX4_9HYPH|nr:ferric reductase-like transmembrane domain-containing protein [Martelella alba]TKI06116.1 oxidoreductase [Martelella alba]
MVTFALRNIVWLMTYIFFIFAPLFALLFGTLPPARDVWTELSIALGYAGLAMMGLQFGLTARFRWVTQPWGEDIIYHFHRQLSYIALALILAHPLLLFVVRPERLALLNIFHAPWRARWASVSTYSLIVIIVMAVWRTKLKIRYEVWHATHIILAIAAVTAGLLHMAAWGRYLVDPVKKTLWIGLTLFWLALLAYVRLIKPLFKLRRPYHVAEIIKERGDTTTLVMKPEGHAGLRFSPGQFGWLTVWGGPFSITAHPFSFSSSAEAADGGVAMSIRNLGDFTAAIAHVREGQRVYLDGPYGTFTLSEPADLYVLVAGGIGITPMMSILRTFADRGDPRPILLLYGNQDWESVIFREELDMLRSRLNLNVVHVLSRPHESWTGERGFINAELFRRHLPPPFDKHEYFICGPDPMMDAIELALADLAVPMSRYHTERYHFA